MNFRRAVSWVEYFFDDLADPRPGEIISIFHPHDPRRPEPEPPNMSRLRRGLRWLAFNKWFWRIWFIVMIWQTYKMFVE